MKNQLILWHLFCVFKYGILTICWALLLTSTRLSSQCFPSATSACNWVWKRNADLFRYNSGVVRLHRVGPDDWCLCKKTWEHTQRPLRQCQQRSKWCVYKLRNTECFQQPTDVRERHWPVPAGKLQQRSPSPGYYFSGFQTGRIYFSCFQHSKLFYSGSSYPWLCFWRFQLSTAKCNPKIPSEIS